MVGQQRDLSTVGERSVDPTHSIEVVVRMMMLGRTTREYQKEAALACH